MRDGGAPQPTGIGHTKRSGYKNIEKQNGPFIQEIPVHGKLPLAEITGAGEVPVNKPAWHETKPINR
ncbi:hypothetical protein GCM10027516_28380 [Niabella aquatica]